MPPLLHIRDFALHRQDGWRLRLSELRLAPGGTAAIHGPSGCGKTTLLLALFGLLPAGVFHGGGAVEFDGQQFAGLSPAARRELLRHPICWVMQDAHGALDPLLPVGRQIGQAAGCSDAEAVAALRELGIDDAAALCRRLPHQISGGQAQRVLLAVAFLRRPRLLIADEPSASLDGGSYADLVARLRELQRAGTAVLMATHDHRLLHDLAADVFDLRDGQFARAAPERPKWPERRSRDSIGEVPVLQADGVRIAFGPRVVLDGVALRLRRGEILALLGESGAGKTTLARVLAGHLVPDNGTVIRPARRPAVQLLFQDALSSLTPGRSLRQLIEEARSPFFDIDLMAHRVGLGSVQLDQPVATLSGGERRRGALLRALAVNPDVLVLDEPTASLDRAAAVAVIDVILELQAQRGLAVLLITHDEDLARAVAHRTVRIEQGRLWQ